MKNCYFTRMLLVILSYGLCVITGIFVANTNFVAVAFADAASCDDGITDPLEGEQCDDGLHFKTLT